MRSHPRRSLLPVLIVLAAAACVPEQDVPDAETAPPTIAVHPARHAYFSDLHIHTGFSFDAFLMFATKTTPDDAYRFAKGEAIEHPLGFPIQLRLSLIHI